MSALTSAKASAARSLWHQRLAWLLMIYVAAVGLTIAPEFGGGRSIPSTALSGLMQCAIIMACVKDCAIVGRPMPYSWRLPMLVTWPVTMFVVEWRARRWWGLFWIAVHGFIFAVVMVVVELIYSILTIMLQR